MHKEQLARAFQLMKEGEKGQASVIVKGVLREDPQNLNAWWLMSHLLDDEDKIVKSLEKVLSIDSNHAGARKRLAELRPEYSNLAPQGSVSTPAKKDALAQDDGYWDKLANPPLQSKPKSNAMGGFLGMVGTRLGLRLVIFAIVAVIGGGMAAWNAFYDQFLIEDDNGHTPQNVIWEYENAYWMEDWDTMYKLSCPDYHATVAKLQSDTYEALGPTPDDLKVDMSGVTMETLQRNPPNKYTIGFHGTVVSTTGGESFTYNYDDDIAEQGGDVWLGEHLTRIDGEWLVCTGPDTIYR